jgi:phenylpropionate dioxygenase-like ring-hydroxylating dioxygenase large terminal subunit
MSMLTNTWYMAAWTDEVVYGRLLARTIANKSLVLFRRTDKAAVLMRRHLADLIQKENAH